MNLVCCYYYLLLLDVERRKWVAMVDGIDGGISFYKKIKEELSWFILVMAAMMGVIADVEGGYGVDDGCW